MLANTGTIPIWSNGRKNALVIPGLAVDARIHSRVLQSPLRLSDRP